MAIKKIKDIYPGYFQKSKVFLYPVLGIKHGSMAPIETYITWENNIKINEFKLIVKHHLRDDLEFARFEDKFLLGNALFEDFKELPDNKALYIFNLEAYWDDWEMFIKGKYSLLSDDLKKMIRNYYGSSTANYAFIHSYLYPKNYFDDYAKFLSPNPIDEEHMKKLLIEVGELCSKPDLRKEELKITIKTLNIV